MQHYLIFEVLVFKIIYINNETKWIPCITAIPQIVNKQALKSEKRRVWSELQKGVIHSPWGWAFSLSVHYSCQEQGSVFPWLTPGGSRPVIFKLGFIQIPPFKPIFLVKTQVRKTEIYYHDRINHQNIPNWSKKTHEV